MVEEIGTKTAGICVGPHNRGSIPMTGASNRAPSDLDAVTCVEISDPAVMGKQPVVSVRMTTYNHEPYIARAIEGVLMQETAFPFELIIGEDGSRDRTREIVQRYAQEHPDIIRLVLWDRNVGPQPNSRKLNELLRGKYLAFNDGDDCWTHPRKLQLQVDIMEANPGVGLVHGGVEQQVVSSGKHCAWEPAPDDYDEGDILLKFLHGKYHVFVAAACVRTDLYRRVIEANPAVFGGRFLMWDVPMWLELSRMTKFRFINEPVATYNVLPESVSNSRDVQKEIRFWSSAMEMWLYYVDKFHVDEATELEVRQRYARRFRTYLRRSTDRESADNALAALSSTGGRAGASDFVFYWSARSGLTGLARAIRDRARRSRS
jgi:glycosyltransferase involved in cell wall biosynthesis